MNPPKEQAGSYIGINKQNAIEDQFFALCYRSLVQSFVLKSACQQPQSFWLVLHASSSVLLFSRPLGSGSERERYICSD